MSATGKEAQVADALLVRLGTLSYASLPIALPEIAFDPVTDAVSGKYFKADMFYNRPAWNGINGSSQLMGFLQVSAVWPRGEGLIAPMEAAQAVVDHFPVTTALFSGTTKVTIYTKPYSTSPLSEGSEVRVSVLIPWKA